MRDLVIIGAGGASREIAGAVADINHSRPTWNLLGFLDDDPHKLGCTIDGVRMLGPISTAAEYSADFIIGIAAVRNRSARNRIGGSLGLPRERFATIVHPSAAVSRYARIGCGSSILHHAVINPDAVIGDHVIVEYGALIGHDSVIENFVTIGPGAIVSGSVRLCRGAFLGAGSVIRDGLTVSEDALVGMGAVVIKDVGLRSTVVGNPARQLRSA